MDSQAREAYVIIFVAELEKGVLLREKWGVSSSKEQETCHKFSTN